MSSNRMILGFSIFAFLMGFLHLAVAGVLQFGGHPGGSELTLLSLVWCAMGGLAAWIGGLLKLQSNRLDRLESWLYEVTEDQK